MINSLFSFKKNVLIKKNLKETEFDYFKNHLFIKNLLSNGECDNILNELSKTEWNKVGVDGKTQNYKQGDTTGSLRATSFNNEISNTIWERISSENLLFPINSIDFDGKQWEPIGINPLIRFIKYEKGGWLIPHYDYPYIQDENTRTLKTVLIYLTNNRSGGTRFLKDPQENTNIHERDYSDWTKMAPEKLVKKEILAETNKSIVFPHRIFHDGGLLLDDKSKIIMFTDILYKKA